MKTNRWMPVCVRQFTVIAFSLQALATAALGQAQTGACCQFDTCTDETQANCNTLAGFYAGDNTNCESGVCNGACCHENNVAGDSGVVCDLMSLSDCLNGAQGEFHGFSSSCDGITCPTTGACCGAGEGCDNLSHGACDSASGTFRGLGTLCSSGTCNGACCTALGCTETTGVDCEENLAGSFQGLGTSCDSNPCGEPTGACCINYFDVKVYCDDNSTESECAQSAPFSTFYPDQTCIDVSCVPPTGACCIPGEGCEELLDFVCVEYAGGTYKGDGTTCESNACGVSRGTPSQKGSLLIYPKIELAWNSSGNPIQDTFLTLINDYPGDVYVHWYFVNGDAPLDAVYAGDPATLVERAHRGWNWVDCSIHLTPNESTYYSAASGLPMGCQPFGVLDPGSPAGRPDPNDPTRRVVRGYAIAFAVDGGGREISWNHLSGGAEIVNYADISAWDYGAYAFQALYPQRAAAGNTSGELHLDGVEYEAAYNQLLFDFFAVGSTAFSRGAVSVMLDTDLTLLPLDIDVREETNGPVTTKAKFDIWNENEDGFSETTRCITMWDQTLLSLYGSPNQFGIQTLHTDKGKARIDGIASQLCDEGCRQVWECDEAPATGDVVAGMSQCHWETRCDVQSADAALLGVEARRLAFSGAVSSMTASGTHLVGQGVQTAIIKHDIISPPETLTTPDVTGTQNSRVQQGSNRISPIPTSKLPAPRVQPSR